MQNVPKEPYTVTTSDISDDELLQGVISLESGVKQYDVFSHKSSVVRKKVVKKLPPNKRFKQPESEEKMLRMSKRGLVLFVEFI